VPVDPLTLETRFPGVYAVGDVTSVGTPKAGVFAEGAAAVVADNLVARFRGGAGEDAYDGRGSCYIEFGRGLVGRVDVQFVSGSPPAGTFAAPSETLTEEKRAFGSSRRARWFGLERRPGP
jgi:sulfide:quinone oxidoreductase